MWSTWNHAIVLHNRQSIYADYAIAVLSPFTSSCLRHFYLFPHPFSWSVSYDGSHNVNAFHTYSHISHPWWSLYVAPCTIAISGLRIVGKFMLSCLQHITVFILRGYKSSYSVSYLIIQPRSRITTPYAPANRSPFEITGILVLIKMPSQQVRK